MCIFLNRFKRLLIVLSFPYLYVLFVLVAPTEQAVTAPGGLTPVENVIQLETVDFVENFNTVYVYSFYPITAFQSFVLANDPQMNLYPITLRQRDTSWRDDYLAGQIAKLVSLKSSIIKAYELAGAHDASIEIEYAYAGLYLYYRPSRLHELHIGDEIIAINGIGYESFTHEDFIRMAYQDDVNLTVRRIGKQSETIFDFQYLYDPEDSYMIFYPNYKIIQAVPGFTLPGLDSVVGGPSGGMIQTLSIYASLLKLNLGDLKIVGTGTIEMSGNVGRIGGIQQKIYTAIDQNTDIFFMPSSHLNEIPDLDYPFEIVAVDTIEEAVNALYERAFG